MAGRLSRRNRNGNDAPYWPGFVDAMAQLLLVIIFLLSVFMLAQFLLARQISGQDSALGQLRSQIAELTQLLALEKGAKADSDAQLLALTDDLNKQKAKTNDLMTNLATQDAAGAGVNSTITGLQTSLDNERKLSSDALSKVELLNQQIAALRRQLATISALLDDSEARNRTSDGQIADLGKRLNVALAQKVEELSRYRSEFFGRLRQILSQRSDILVVGDRFVFQSEVLFSKGSADLNDPGQAEMLKLAEALKQLETEIPPDIKWILRVDGHTDNDPIILGAKFSSNWELSSARAIAVVKFLVAHGVAPEHLAAAGFGEFQPIAPGNSEDAKAQNRRIELKLTEK
ncbi:MAG: peptidoglycan -binding protein [Aestuariivirga sp.]